MRITTGMMLRNYKTNLNKSLSNLNSARTKVLTERNFSSIKENPAGATKAFQLRREFVKTEDSLDSTENAMKHMDVVADSILAMSQMADQTKQEILSSLNGATSLEARKTYAQSLRGIAENMVLNINAQYGDKFVFGGAGTKDVPIQFDKETGILTYRGIDVNSTDPDDIAKLQEFAKESLYIDLGFGLEETAPGEIISSSAFDIANCALNVLGFGNVNASEIIKDTTPPTIAGTPATSVNTYTDGNPANDKTEIQIDFSNMTIDKSGTIKLNVMGQEVVSTEIAPEDISDPNKLAAAFAGATFTITGDDGTEYKFTADVVEDSKVKFSINQDLQATNNFAGGTTLATALTNTPPTVAGEAAGENNVTGETQEFLMSNNIVTLMCDIADLIEQEPLNDERLGRMLDQFTVCHNNLIDARTQIDTKAQFLDTTKTRLTNTLDNINEKIIRLEKVDLAEAITNYSYAQYAYNSALRVGNSILSNSFIDFMG